MSGCTDRSSFAPKPPPVAAGRMRTRLWRQAQDGRRLDPVHGRGLGAGVDGEDVAIHPGDARLGLDIGVLDMGGGDRGLGDVGGPGQRGGGVALAHEAARQQVAGAIRMDERRAGGLGLGRVEEMGQRLPPGGEAGQIERSKPLGLAGDERYGLAAEARPALGQRRLVGEIRDDAEAVAAGDVGGGEDVDAMRPRPGGEIAEGEAGVGVRRADGADGEPAARLRIGPEVGAEAVGAAHLGRPVEALGRGADGAARRDLGGRRRLAPCVADGVEDLGIAGAAAEHAAQRGLGLGPRRERGAGEERCGGHQHSRRADAALGGAVPQEGTLQAVELRARGTGRQALDGRDLAADRGGGRREAGADGSAVEQHRAGAAVARIAADLGAGEAQHLAQRVGEAPGRLDAQPCRRAVDGQTGGWRVEAHAVAAGIARAAAAPAGVGPEPAPTPSPEAGLMRRAAPARGE